MKRVGSLLARSLIGALLLLALTSNIASADPGNGQGGPLPQLIQPEDPGTSAGLQPQIQPEDPGFSD
jgi:hypothetical protein